MNIAQDVYGWLWFAKAVVIAVLLVWIARDVHKLSKSKGQQPKLVGNIALKFCALAVAILALFVFFGPGEAVEHVDTAEDGHRQLVESRPAPAPESTIREEAKAKKDSYLKAVDESPEAARKEANDYLKKALERSKK